AGVGIAEGILSPVSATWRMSPASPAANAVVLGAYGGNPTGKRIVVTGTPVLASTQPAPVVRSTRINWPVAVATYRAPSGPMAMSSGSLSGTLPALSWISVRFAVGSPTGICTIDDSTSVSSPTYSIP